MLQFCTFKFDGLSFPPPVFDGSQPFRLTVEEYSSLPLSPDSQSSSLTSDRPISVTEGTLFNKEDVDSSDNSTPSDHNHDERSSIATPSNDTNGAYVYGDFDGDKDVASRGSDVSEICQPFSPCTNEILDDVTSIISDELESSLSNNTINQVQPDDLFASKSFVFNEIASKSVSVTEVKVDGSITSTSSTYLDCEPSLNKSQEADDTAFKVPSVSHIDSVPSSFNNTDNDETVDASSLLSELVQVVDSSKSSTETNSDETIIDILKTASTNDDSPTESTIDSFNLQGAPTVPDIVPESQSIELKEPKSVDASQPVEVTYPVEARISESAAGTELKNDTKIPELICEPSCSKSGPVILKPIDSSSSMVAAASTANRNSCRKSTAPRNFFPFRPQDEKTPSDDGDNDHEDEDEAMNILGANSDLSSVDNDSSDDEINQQKCVGQDSTQKLKKLKKSPYPSRAEVCSAILDDVLLQLVPKVHILRLPNYMVPPDDKAEYLEQIYSTLNDNLFRDGEERLGYIKRYVPKSKTPAESDDDSIPFTAPSTLNATPVRKRVLLVDDTDESEDEKLEIASEVKKKRAKMSSGGKKRQRCFLSDSSSDDDPDNIDSVDYGIVWDSDDKDDVNSNELGDMDEDSKALFWKKSKLAFTHRKPHDLVTLSSDEEEIVELVELVPEADDTDVVPSSQKSERKEIRRVLTEAELEKATKDATSQERKRMERITEMQKQYSQILSEIGADKDNSRLILDIDVKSKQVRVDVHKALVKELKEHQREGIKFMYNSTIESIEKLKDEGSGCILAHCMGLGKTLQVITFVYTLLKNKFTREHIKTVMIAVPVNTLKNWSDEFNKWITKNGLQTFNVFEMLEENENAKRAVLLDNWNREGGVLIIGTSILASLCDLRCAKRKNTSLATIETIEKFLTDPGPDMLIVDEGHTLKQTGTKLCKAVLRIKTKRKIMLTGTPLQNNLGEYHTMISIIKPRLLGSKKEFANRFRNPIENGHKADSNEYDVKLMKTRALVLHKLLDGCIQRYDYETLKPFLQPKIEFFVYIRPTKLIADMYNYYLDNVKKRVLLWDVGCLRLCTNHPALYQLQENRELAKQEASNRYYAKKIKRKKISFLDDLRTDSTLKPSASKNGQETVTVPDQTSTSKSAKVNSDQSEPSASKSNATNAVDEQSQPSASKTSNSAATTPTVNENGNNVENPSKVDNIELGDSEFPEAGEPERLPRDWFKAFIKPDDWQKMELSCKFVMLFKILRACIAVNDKLLVASQSLETLDLIERYLKMNKEMLINNEKVTIDWKKGRDYFRIDGNTGAAERQEAIELFNTKNNGRLFLLSTKAGGVGVNLVGANRCVIFDASWNPSDDTQAIFRIYRLGQTKPVFVYRFVVKDSMEEKISRKQIVKLSTAIRVLDKQQVKRNYKGCELDEFYNARPQDNYEISLPNPPKDTLLADLLCKDNKEILDYTLFDSLLEIKPDEDLPEEERQAAWAEYQKERDAEIQAAEERKRVMEEEKRKEEEKRQKEAKEEELRNEKARIEKAKEEMYKRLATSQAATSSPSEGTTSTTASSSAGSKEAPAVSRAPVVSADQAKGSETSTNSSKSKDSSKSGQTRGNDNIKGPSNPLTDTNRSETVNISPDFIVPRMQSHPRIVPGIGSLSSDYINFENHIRAFAYKSAPKPRVNLAKESNIKTRSNRNTGLGGYKQRNPPAPVEDLTAKSTTLPLPNQRNHSSKDRMASSSSSSSASNSRSTTSTPSSSSNNRNASTSHHNNDRNQNIPKRSVRKPDRVSRKLPPGPSPHPSNIGPNHHRNRIIIQNPTNQQKNYQHPPQAAHSGWSTSNPNPMSNYTQPPPTTSTTPYKGFSSYHHPPLPPPPPSYRQPAATSHRSDRTHSSSANNLPSHTHQRSSHPSSNGNSSTSTPLVVPSTQSFIDTRLTKTNKKQPISCTSAETVDSSLNATNHSSIVPNLSSSSHVILEETSDDLLDPCDAILNRVSGLNLAECKLSDLIQTLLTLEGNMLHTETTNCAESIIEEIEKTQSALSLKINRLDEKSRIVPLTIEELSDQEYCEKSLSNLQRQVDEVAREFN